MFFLKECVFRCENGWKLRKNAPNCRETSRIVFGDVVNLERIVPFRLCGAPVCFSTVNRIRGPGMPIGYRRQCVSREARRLLYREGITTGKEFKASYRQGVGCVVMRYGRGAGGGFSEGVIYVDKIFR